MFYFLVLQELLVGTVIALLWELSDERGMFVQPVSGHKGTETVLEEAYGGFH